jgi:hypothetical protein
VVVVVPVQPALVSRRTVIAAAVVTLAATLILLGVHSSGADVPIIGRSSAGARTWTPAAVHDEATPLRFVAAAPIVVPTAIEVPAPSPEAMAVPSPTPTVDEPGRASLPTAPSPAGAVAGAVDATITPVVDDVVAPAVDTTVSVVDGVTGVVGEVLGDVLGTVGGATDGGLVPQLLP